jgi:hypothetical protein
MCSSISSRYLRCISQISQNEVHGGSLSWKEGRTYYRVKAMNTETWEELCHFSNYHNEAPLNISFLHGTLSDALQKVNSYCI